MSTVLVGDSNGEGPDEPSVAQREKQTLFESSQELQDLCRDNGISERQFVHRSDAVTSLEMFLGFWESMKSVMHFPALRELYIVNHPTVRVLEGIDKCVGLEVLAITECSLTCIGRSILSCTRLRTVNFSSNKLRTLDNLDALEQLETLWVNENALETLDGLRKLSKLSQLWACRNQIDRLDASLNACSSLKELNLAGNRLSSFKSLLPLANLDSLAILTLSDPHFGDNPVCKLCNYQTYLMCHLSNLAFLDTIEVSQRIKQIAEATMVKKKVYYNMRIRSIQRDVRAQIQRFKVIHSHTEQQLNANVTALVRQKKEIECFLAEHEQSLPEGASRENQATAQLVKKVECLRACLEQQFSAIHHLKSDFDRLCTDLLVGSDRNASRLMLELETAGNIRLEDGKATDAWYASCVDLLRSRLCVDELSQFGIVDIRIGRVTRVSNRFLRNRFLSRMEEIVVVPELDAKENVSKKGITIQSREGKALANDQPDMQTSNLVDEEQQPRQHYPGSSLDKSVEYLFYMQPPWLDRATRSSNAEQYYVAENGFRDPTEYEKAGVDGAIKLSNSIAMLDTDRIRAEVSHHGRPSGLSTDEKPCQASAEGVDNTTDPLALASRVLMIVKAFPGQTKSASMTEVIPPTVHGAASLVRSKDYAGLHSLQLLPPDKRSAPDASSLSQKLYYVFDKALVLPEYLVEFQYVMRGDKQAAPQVTRAENCSRPALSESDVVPHDEEMSLTARCADLSSDEESILTGFASQHVDAFERKYRSRRRHGAVEGEGVDEATTRVLQMGPSLPQASASAECVRASALSTKLQPLELSNVKVVNLMGCKLQAVPDLSAVRGRLETLVVSYNCIQTTSGLAGLASLRVLDLSFNQIGQLGQLEDLRSLDTLDVSHNLIKGFRDVEYLGRTFANSSMRRLNLRSNALCESKRYRLHMLQSLPLLSQLDHQPVDKHEVIAAAQLITKLSSAKIFSVCDSNSRPMAQTGAGGTLIETESSGQPLTVEAWAAIEHVALDRELISAIEGLQLAVNLRVATFADNVISSIGGLESCRRLEELCLDDNEIERIEHLEHLTMLKKLHLGRNRISVIEGLASLENLVQLSLEDNHISSLRGLGGLVKLMELYLGNNKIEVLKDIQHLKSLPKLTILDLVGNDICRLPDYRVYCVYHLRRVKVLDGATVSAQDQSCAKQKYSGKLTLEFIMEKCGVGSAVTPRPGSGLDRIVVMDLSSCRLRDLGVLTGKNFPIVREINLENNQISDINGMEALFSLRKLNLSRNRIERLAPLGPNGAATTASLRSPPSNAMMKGILACAKLEQLYLGYNHISDMSTLGLQFVHDLKVLHLQGNSITQVAGLEINSELQDLRLDKNRIRQLDANSVQSLRQLRVLSVEDNGLKTLAAFDYMISLEVLEASNNRLVDLEELDRLVPLRSLSDLRLENNPVTKKHLYRASVVSRLAFLSTLDGREVSSDERERAATLFAHERAAAAALASVATYASRDRLVDARAGYPSAVASAAALAPFSLPVRTGAAAYAGTAASLPHDALSGSLLRRNYVVPSPFAIAQGSILSGQSIPLPDQQPDLRMAIAPSHTTTKSLMPPSQSLRATAAHSNQAAGGSRSHLASPSGTVTVASALNASLPFAPYGGGQQRPERRRLASVHYDQPAAGVGVLPGTVESSSLDVKLPASQPLAKPPGALARQGVAMHPSSAEAVLSRSGGAYPKAECSLKSVSDGADAPQISGYVVTYGNQKRYPNYSAAHPDTSTSIPYLSTKLQQHAVAGNTRLR